MPDTLVDELKQLLSADRVISDPSELYVYDCDGFTIARSTPGAVVFPTSTDDVVRVVKLLAERDVQIVPRGSGTGLTGGCVAFEIGVDGGHPEKRSGHAIARRDVVAPHHVEEAKPDSAFL